MRVKVKFFTLFRLEYGLSELNLELPEEDITIRDLLKIIDIKTGKNISKKLFTDDKKVKTSAIVLVNGKNIFHIRGLDTNIRDRDVISLFPPGGGG